MGCGSSKTTAVQPVRSGELEGDEEETASKHGGRGDSAVSKGTTDSGVVMENKEISMLPGAVPMKLPPLTASPGLLRRDSPVAERPKSSEILEQLLNQGIIPVGQPRESGSKAGEAYNIMLDDGEVPKRRPPARLESLKARKEQVPNSREAIDQKMRLAEERRKLREEDLKMRLRTKSARVRGPAPSDTFTPVEELQKPLTPESPGSPESHEDSRDPPLHTKVREAAEGREGVREAAGDGREGDGGSREDRRTEGDEGGGSRGDVGEDRESGDGGALQEEVSPVEELKAGQLLTASGELESDSTFLYAAEDEQIF